MEEEFISLNDRVSSTKESVESNNNIEISSRFKNINETPWLPFDRDVAFASPPLIQLHNEIIAFYNFIEPTEEEMRIRNSILTEVSNIVRELFPTATFQVFGYILDFLH